MSSPAPITANNSFFSPSPIPGGPPIDVAMRSVDLGIGATVALLNIVEIVLISKIKRRKTVYERLLLSLSVSDMLFGLSDSMVCSVHIAHGLAEKPSDDDYLIGASYALFLCFQLTSIIHILVINLDRLWSVSAPLKHRVHATMRRLHFVIAATWIIPLIAAITVFLFDRQLEETADRQNLQNETIIVAAWLILAGDIFYLTLYGALMYKIKTLPKVGDISKRQNTRDTESSVIAACTVITFFYIGLTAPYMLNALLDNGYVHMACTVLLVINSGVNSVVYFFRGKLKQMKCCDLSRDTESTTGSSFSTELQQNVKS